MAFRRGLDRGAHVVGVRRLARQPTRNGCLRETRRLDDSSIDWACPSNGTRIRCEAPPPPCCVAPQRPPPEAYHALRSTRWLVSCIRLLGGGPAELEHVRCLRLRDRLKAEMFIEGCGLLRNQAEPSEGWSCPPNELADECTAKAKSSSSGFEVNVSNAPLVWLARVRVAIEPTKPDE
jgi:hypothetical protein